MAFNLNRNWAPLTGLYRGSDKFAGESDEAVRLFLSIIEERPTLTNAYTNVAYVLRETGRLRAAIDNLEKAIAQGLQTRTMLGRLGAYLQEAGETEESATLLEALIEAHPIYAEAYNYLGVSYARLGRTQDAVRALNKLLTLDSSYASGYANLGSVYLGVGRIREAEENFRRALEIDPRLAGGWNGIGVIAANEGHHEDAITAWRRSVELDPRHYDTIYNLGTLLTKQNRFSEAIPYLEMFVETAPQDRYAADIPKIRRLLSQLRTAWGNRSP